MYKYLLYVLLVYECIYYLCVIDVMNVCMNINYMYYRYVKYV